MILTYEKAVTFEFFPGIVCGGDYLVALQWQRAIVPVEVDELRVMFSSLCSFPFGHKRKPCKTESSAVI